MEDVIAIGHHSTVVLNALQPPPHCITAIKTGPNTLSQQVRDQAMSQCACKGQDDVPVKQDEEKQKELRGRNLLLSLRSSILAVGENNPLAVASQIFLK